MSGLLELAGRTNTDMDSAEYPDYCRTDGQHSDNDGAGVLLSFGEGRGEWRRRPPELKLVVRVACFLAMVCLCFSLSRRTGCLMDDMHMEAVVYLLLIKPGFPLEGLW